MTTNNKDFRVKNGLVVDGANATVNGNEVLTNAASINALSDVTVSSPTSGQVLKWNGSAWINDSDATSAGGGGNSFETISANGTSVVADSSTDTLTFTPGDGLSIAGNATSDTITFTPNVAGASANGIVTTGTQTFAGEKTFSNNITASANIVANTGFVSADTFRLDTTYTGGSTQPGEISWDPDNETAMIALDAGETLQIGQEHVVRVKNFSASVAIPKGRVVMFAGATGDTVTVTPAVSTQAYEPLLLLGVTAEEIAADGFGFVTQYGFINQVSTGSFTLGDLLYVDPVNPGVLINSAPSAPNWTFPVAAVTRVHASAGRILVRAIPGGHLHDVVDVSISSPADNELLAYNFGNGTWINQTAEEAGVANLSGATFTGNVAGTNANLSGNVNAVTVNATTLIGNTNASTITTGTIDNARTNANAANGASTIVARDANGSFAGNVITATTFSGSGASLTSIPSIVTDDTKPSTPVDGQVWFNSATGKTYVYYVDTDGGQWVEIFGSKDISDLKSRTLTLESDFTEFEQAANNRNFIINGGFDIWQRGTSGFSSGAYNADRWYAGAGSGGACAVSRGSFDTSSTAVPSDIEYYLSYEQTTAATSATPGPRTYLEGVRTLAGKTATVSFYAKASTSISIVPRLYQSFGTGGSPSTAVTTEFPELAQTVTTSWARYSVTFTIPSILSTTIGTDRNDYLLFQFITPLDSTYTFDVTGVQLEEGSVATPFRRNAPNFQAELAACQRYYVSITTGTSGVGLFSGFAYNTTSALVTALFPVSMRSTPVLVLSSASHFGTSSSNGTGITPTAIALAGTSTITARINITVSSGYTAGQGTFLQTSSTSAVLAFDAEL